MEQLSSLNTSEPIDYDNLNIVTHPRPPRRRQSGVSLVPFRPYVKCLTGSREPFSFASGEDQWVTSGQRETFFKQENARCIGSLLDDCDISDVIRWDIQGESTRLPMMCKLWMIVDGAVVERGKPHLVQDAAVQVLTAGRNYRTILAAEQRYNPTVVTTFDRRRRQSWHEVNEYHSVPYYQYTRSVRSGDQRDIQCNMDNEYLTSTQHNLSCLDESVDEHLSQSMDEQIAKETIHNQTIPQDRVQISTTAHKSMTTQTEYQLTDFSTEIDKEFIQMFNLNLETNENLLSSIVSPYNRHFPSNSTSWEITSWYRRGIEFINRSVSTGDDYPQWWLQLSTNVLLSDHLTNQGESKEKSLPLPSPVPSLPSTPRQCHEQSVQTDTEKPIETDNKKVILTETEKGIQTDVDKVRPPSSTRSSRVRNSSSSMTMSNHYQFIDEIDDGNNDQRHLTFPDQRQRTDSHADLESRSSDGLIDISSNNDHDRIRRTTRTSSKHSDTDYNTFSLALDHRPFSTPDHQHFSTPDHQHFSTPDHQHVQLSYRTSNNEQNVHQNQTSANPSSLGTLLQRYERTYRDRQQPVAIVNDELLDVDQLLKRYREKVENSPRTTNEATQPLEFQRDVTIISSRSKDERRQSSSSSISRLVKPKYLSIPGETTEEIIQGYCPLSEIRLHHCLLNSPRQRQPRYDYYDLTLTDDGLNSAWIRYNEQRIDQLQKRIDLMLQIDDNEEAQFLLSTINPITNTVTEHIDDLLMKKSKHRTELTSSSDRILLPRRNQFRLPYRLNQTMPNSPRLLSRNVSRSTTPMLKSVRISTNKDFIPNRTRLNAQTTSNSSSRPIVSILRRPHTVVTARPHRVVDKSHVWKSDVDGKVYVLEQFSIPRYYRLYNDVSFREVYQFSRLLETYIDQHQKPSEFYSSLIRNFAVDQQLPTVTSIA